MRGPALCLVRKCWIIRSEVTRFRFRGTSPKDSLSYSAYKKSLAVAFVFNSSKHPGETWFIRLQTLLFPK